MRPRSVIFIGFAFVLLGIFGLLTATREKIVVAKGNGFVKGRCLSCGDSTKSKRLFRFKF